MGQGWVRVWVRVGVGVGVGPGVGVVPVVGPGLGLGLGSATTSTTTWHLHDGGPDGDGAQGRPHVAAQEGVVADAHGGVRGEVRIRVRVES